jgi:hypothetical protein
MHVTDLVKAKSREFLAERIGCSEAVGAVRLAPVENAVLRFKGPSSRCFLLSRDPCNGGSGKPSEQFFVKIATRAEVEAHRLVAGVAPAAVAHMFECVPLDETGRLHIAFFEYVDGGNELWSMLNALRMRNEHAGAVTDDLARCASETLGLLARKLAALHWLLSAGDVLQAAPDRGLAVFTEGLAADMFRRGSECLAGDHMIDYLREARQEAGLGRILESRRDSLVNSLTGYPHGTLLHGDLQVANIRWSPRLPGRFCLVDWEHSFSGPAVLDLCALSYGFTEPQFLQPYFETIGTLTGVAIPHKERSRWAAAGAIYQSIRLLLGAEEAMSSAGAPGVAKEVQLMLLTRIANLLDLF